MGGKSLKTVQRFCKHCNKEFMAAPWNVEHGLAIFCSANCSRWGRQPRTPEQRFLSLLDKEPNGCWVWKTGKSSSKHYPNFWYGTKKVKAHHFAYQKWHGPIEAGKEVNHSCDNPRCVNPAHLYLATHKKNMKDAGIKGRLSWVVRLETDRDRYQSLYLKSEEQKDELARRLKRACEFIRVTSNLFPDYRFCGQHLDDLADELEKIPEGEK